MFVYPNNTVSKVPDPPLMSINEFPAHPSAYDAAADVIDDETSTPSTLAVLMYGAAFCVSTYKLWFVVSQSVMGTPTELAVIVMGEKLTFPPWWHALLINGDCSGNCGRRPFIKIDLEPYEITLPL